MANPWDNVTLETVRDRLKKLDEPPPTNDLDKNALNVARMVASGFLTLKDKSEERRHLEGLLKHMEAERADC